MRPPCSPVLLRWRPASRGRGASWGRASAAGFTLVEMMIVVIIVGILATLATIGVRKYLLSSKTNEAIYMIGSIKAAQEAYKDETFRYLDVSSSLTSGFYPGDPGLTKYAWNNPAHSDYARWNELGVETSSPVQFGYATKAGTGGTVPQVGTAENLPYPTTSGPWYVVRASSDLNGDGVLSIYTSSSFTSEIYFEGEGE
ncbi:MAG: prepilin-type N-terminal cleavage/methylation domain-containing protein [Polyangiaceae bacterium]|nr:prepilin-type N-terminal cleavage/methylation domain-containing protein [Polyangiaceae bacterium]MCW5791507.1 prepilin-type N-terminal cleavage/methylation domain-containing protein [Polyangiaceae bacterium]